MRFDITMTFEGVTTAYDDVATFQWEPFGPSNQVPIGTVTGTVRLPDGGDGSLSRAWLHFSGTSETSRSNNVLQFNRIRRARRPASRPGRHGRRETPPTVSSAPHRDGPRTASSTTRAGRSANGMSRSRPQPSVGW